MTRLGVLVLLLVSLAACGREPRVHVIAREDLPADVYATPSPSPPPAVPRSAVVYFVRDARLFGVDRLATDPSALAEFVVRELLAGPTADEQAAGVGTAIPEGTELLGVSVRDGVAFVNLSREYELGAAQEVLLVRISQVVYTLTELRRIERVEFLIDGERVDVVGEDGTILRDPVGRDDYPAFAPVRAQAAALSPPLTGAGRTGTSGARCRIDTCSAMSSASIAS